MALVSTVWAGPAEAAGRVALVVGNGAYEHAGALRNPANDARDVSAMLEGLGFEVLVGIDLDGESLGNVLADFGARLPDADVALFYYSGHGIQFESHNYLIPVDAGIANQFALRRETIQLDQILSQMESAQISLAFIDACRNNPLSEQLTKSLAVSGRATAVARGLAPIQITGRDMLVAFAAAPGEVALDGEGRNSPFTTAILQHLPTPNVEISTVLKRVTQSVRDQTRGQQKPEQLASMGREFYMLQHSVPAPQPVPEPQNVPAPQPGVDTRVEETAFAAAVQINTPVAWNEFLALFPGGRYTAIANEALRKLTVVPSPTDDDNRLSALRAQIGLAISSRNYQVAARLSEEAAAGGDVTSIGDLAYFYSLGLGVPRDEQRAEELFVQAVRAANPIARYNYGWFIDRRKDVAPDSDEAAAQILSGIAQAGGAVRTDLLAALISDARQLTPATRRAIQRRLAAEGKYRGQIDGDFGPATQRALSALGTVQ